MIEVPAKRKRLGPTDAELGDSSTTCAPSGTLGRRVRVGESSSRTRSGYLPPKHRTTFRICSTWIEGGAVALDVVSTTEPFAASISIGSASPAAPAGSTAQ